MGCTDERAAETWAAGRRTQLACMLHSLGVRDGGDWWRSAVAATSVCLWELLGRCKRTSRSYKVLC